MAGEGQSCTVNQLNYPFKCDHSLTITTTTASMREIVSEVTRRVFN